MSGLYMPWEIKDQPTAPREIALTNSKYAASFAEGVAAHFVAFIIWVVGSSM